MRVKGGVRAGHSAANPKYFGPDRGVTFYGHLADIYMPFGRQQVISTNDREALYVLDTLCHYDTDFAIREHFTDTAGYTEQVFGLCMLLGFQFAPRIRDVLDRRLYTLSGIGVPGVLQSLVTARIRTRLIVEYWAELRRRVQVGLNKGEAKHALGRALFFGRHGELWERAVTAQVYRASGLHLLIAGIGAWNTVYLGQALAALAAEGQPVPAEYLPHIAPLGWEHINLLGHYSFAPSAPGSLERLRPLRNAADSDSMKEEPPALAPRQAHQRAAKSPGTGPTRATHSV